MDFRTFKAAAFCLVSGALFGILGAVLGGGLAGTAAVGVVWLTWSGAASCATPQAAFVIGCIGLGSLAGLMAGMAVGIRFAFPADGDEVPTIQNTAHLPDASEVRRKLPDGYYAPDEGFKRS